MIEPRASGPPPDWIGGVGHPNQLAERVIGTVLGLCAALVVVVGVGVVLVLVAEAVRFFAQVSIVEFLTETRWTPRFQEKHFGILPLLAGSILVATGAGILALPGGLLTAIFLSEYSRPSLRAVLKPLLEVLAGIPTVVYGYFALTFVTPLLQGVIPGLGAFNALSASLVLGVMILPTVAFLSEDALRAVPRAQRDAAFGLGATRLDVVRSVVIPVSLPGILAAFFLGLSRAFGETMVVAMAAGNAPNLTLNPLESVQTMAAHILQVGQGSVAPGTLDFQALVAVGMMLFLVTLALNMGSHWVRARVVDGHR